MVAHISKFLGLRTSSNWISLFVNLQHGSCMPTAHLYAVVCCGYDARLTRTQSCGVGCQPASVHGVHTQQISSAVGTCMALEGRYLGQYPMPQVQGHDLSRNGTIGSTAVLVQVM
jgi:hypothetical protein